MVAMYDWSGFYIGANGGWGSSHKCWDFTTPAGAFIFAEGCHDATGGVAFTRTNYSAVFTPSTNPASLFGFGCPGAAATTCFGTSAVAFSQDKAGWVAGVGGEWRIAPHWLVRLEYLHYGFDGATGIVPAVLANGTAACAGCGWRANWNHLDIDSVRVGAAYQFGGPVVAKY